MNRQTRLVFFFLVALVAILAGSTSFFAAKTYKMNSGSKIEQAATLSATIDSSADVNTSPQPTSTSSIIKPATSAEKPSKPADTYTIQKGETLFAIAQAQGLNWQDIAEANGLTDVDKIHAGQVIILPKGGQINFTIDNTRATSLQKDTGKYQFRLSPEETARSDAPNAYGLQVGDSYVLKNRDESGNAQVQATRESKNYIIKLIQPITKGEEGIWAIESIRPV